MRIPVFARGANPRIDRPIMRKSESYATLQVSEALADWINPDDHSAGIVCRVLLYFGERSFYAETVDVDSISPSSPHPDAGLKFVRPNTWQNQTLTRVQLTGLLAAAPIWDWSCEPKSADPISA